MPPLTNQLEKKKISGKLFPTFTEPGKLPIFTESNTIMPDPLKINHVSKNSEVNYGAC